MLSSVLVHLSLDNNKGVLTQLLTNFLANYVNRDVDVLPTCHRGMRQPAKHSSPKVAEPFRQFTTNKKISTVNAHIDLKLNK